MRFTEEGSATLERYVGRVRTSLRGRTDIDAEDVVAGLREHVEAELTVRSVELATVEDVSSVLEDLGPADSLGGSAGEGGQAPPDRETDGRVDAAVLLTAALGAALLPTRHLPIGVALLATAVVAARLVLPRPHAAGSARLVRGVWRGGAVAGALVLLLAPAALAWGAAQIGGLLEGPLALYVDVRGTDRPGRYWVAAAAVMCSATGAWWLMLAAILRGIPDRIGNLLEPGRGAIPRRAARTLALAGVTLVTLSLFGAWWS